MDDLTPAAYHDLSLRSVTGTRPLTELFIYVYTFQASGCSFITHSYQANDVLNIV